MGASSLELQTGASVMAIGGFKGSDDSPTLHQFQQYVTDQQIHYFIADGMAGSPDDRSPTAGDITAWVQQHFTPTDVGGTTVYDLSSPAN
jgi:4-amino-4-deoxy-L-arabinose transferase-like glycosyltransferase